MTADSTPHLPSRRRQAPPRNNSLVAILLLGFALLAVLALMLDISGKAPLKKQKRASPNVTAELQEIVLGMNNTPWTDPKGFFRIVPPAGWRVFHYPDTTPYNASFSGPNSADISIMATPVAYNTLPELYSDIRKRQQQYGVVTDIDSFFFRGKPAARRTCRLNNVKIFAIDFVENYVAHHIICTMPPQYFDKYYPVLMDVLNTYQPLTNQTGQTQAR